jgi:chromosome segregation ATPase
MNDLERAMRDAITDLEDKLTAAKADAERERAARRAIDQALAEAIRERDDARRRVERLRAAL